MAAMGPIYLDASQRATLRRAGTSTEYLTVEEAVRDWHNLAEELQEKTTLFVPATGRVYKPEEIRLIHRAPKS